MANLTPEQLEQLADHARLRRESIRQSEAPSLTQAQMAQLAQHAEQRRQSMQGNNLEVAGDLNSGKLNVDQFVGMEFKNGHYEMPPQMIEAARNMAKQLINIAKEQGVDLTKSEQWKDAAALTKSGRMTEDALASYILARSMGADTEKFLDGPFVANPQNGVTSTFTNRIDQADYKADPKMVFEMARQIMGDNGMRDVVGAATNVPAADREFTNSVAGNANTPGIVAKC